MNLIANTLLGLAAAGVATLSLIADVPVLGDIATFFALGGLIGGAVVYRAERSGRELSALQVRQVLFRWAFTIGALGAAASLLAELL
ncbi:MAG: hypothetical protein LC777_13545 [Actinobacteria bacterium]|nr:hypothetical protein [Actinomycetota bacterium]